MASHCWLVGDVDGLGDHKPVFRVLGALLTQLLLDAAAALVFCDCICLSARLVYLALDLNAVEAGSSCRHWCSARALRCGFGVPVLSRQSEIAERRPKRGGSRHCDRHRSTTSVRVAPLGGARGRLDGASRRECYNCADQYFFGYALRGVLRLRLRLYYHGLYRLRNVTSRR